MKKYSYFTMCSLALFGTSTMISQQADDIEKNSQPVVKYTLMERFEPELTLTLRERKRMKAERFAEIKLKMQMLDTMDISERRREKLLSDVIEKPYSTRLSRNMADSQFEEEN